MYDWSIAQRMAAEGACATQIAAEMGCPRDSVYHWARKAGVKLQRANPAGRAHAQRNARMAEMYRQGVTLAKLGEQFGVTRQLVHQVMTSMGIAAVAREMRAGAAAVKAKQGRRAVEARVYAKWGVEYDLWRQLRADGTVRAYEQQRANSNKRSIEWALTFADWYAVWQASGKLHLRGKGKGKYCMSRIKDAGGYVLGNVHVQLVTENSRDAVEKWRGKTKVHRGVYLLYPGRERAWLARVGKVRLGYFASEEAAAAARGAYINARA